MRGTMITRVGLVVVACAALAACSGAPPSAEQRAATDLNPSGRPVQAPSLYQPQRPPNSANAFNPLYCHSEGPGTVCERQPD